MIPSRHQPSVANQSVRYARRCPSAAMLMILLTLAVATAGVVSAADWPAYRHDDRRSGKTDERIDAGRLGPEWVWRSPHPPQPAWFGPARWDAYAGLRGLRSMRNYDPVFHTIAVGDRVYFGSSADDAVHALDAGTGRRLWSFVTDGPVRAAPTHWQGKLYFASDDGHAYCVRAADGRLVWVYRPSPPGRMILNNGRLIPRWPCRTGVVVKEGLAYFGASLLPWHPSYLCAVDAETGRPEGKGTFVQKFDGLTMEGPLTASSHQLIAPQGRVEPRLFALADGRSLGSLQGGGGSFVVLTDEDLILHGPGNKEGWITGSDAKTRAKIATYKSGNAIIVAGKMSYLLTDTSLRASDWVNRKHHWSIDSRYPYSLILAGDTLLAGGTDEVAAFDAATGRLVWKHAVAGRAFGLAVAGGRLLVSTDVGAVYSFRPGANAKLPELIPVKQHHATKRLAASETIRPAVGPWVRFTAPDRAVVRWHTDRPSPTILEYDFDGRTRRVEDKSPKTSHRAVLTGLGRNRLGSYVVKTIADGREGDSQRYELDTFFNYTVADAAERPNRVAGANKDDEAAQRVAKEAQHILTTSQRQRGICLMLGCGDGRLAYELVRHSKLRVIAVETDPAKVDAARRMLMRAGVYGGRVSVLHVDSLTELPTVGEFANLVVSADGPGGRVPRGLAAEIPRVLKPGGGVALVGQPAGAAKPLIEREPLKGAGEWSHLYGRADNSAFGGESLSGVKATGELEVQWIGRPGPRFQVDRNGRKPSPLSTGGRLFVQGHGRIAALDAHNGVVLWSLEIPDLGRFNMPRDCGNWCADEKYVLAAVRDKCWRIDAETGTVSARFDALPAGNKSWKYDWGYVAIQDGTIIGSAVKEGTSWTNFWGKADAGWYDAPAGPVTDKVCSDNLFALDKETGKTKWQYTGGVVINSTVTAAGRRLYFVESRSSKVRHADTRRVGMPELWQEQFLVALDADTGQKSWERSLAVAPGSVVFYLAHAGDRLVLTSSGNKQYQVYAYDAADGADRWEAGFAWPGGKADHGSHMSRPAIAGGRVYVRPQVMDLATGKVLPVQMPGGGCGTYACAAGALFFRGGSGKNAMVWDRDGGSLTQWERLRPDCWLSAIPAAGMLLMPEGGGGCSCGKWLETSVGFLPRSVAEAGLGAGRARTKTMGERLE